MSIDVLCTHDVPFMFWLDRSRGSPVDWRLVGISWEEPEELEDGDVNGWVIDGMGDVADGTRWRKGEHAIEVVHACLTSGGDTFFASGSREALDEWRRDHGLKGSILENETVSIRG